MNLDLSIGVTIGFVFSNNNNELVLPAIVVKHKILTTATNVNIFQSHRMVKLLADIIFVNIGVIPTKTASNVLNLSILSTQSIFSQQDHNERLQLSTYKTRAIMEDRNQYQVVSAHISESTVNKQLVCFMTSIQHTQIDAGAQQLCICSMFVIVVFGLAQYK